MNNYFYQMEQQKMITKTLLPAETTEDILIKGLVDKSSTRIEGLFRKYPYIWDKRKKGTPCPSIELVDENFKKSFLKLYLYYFCVRIFQLN